MTGRYNRGDVRLLPAMLVPFLSALTCAALWPAGAGAAQPLEYQVKAAYLFNLVNAAEWPASAFASPSAPFTVCVAEPSPFGAALDHTFANEHVGSHPIAVSFVAAPDQVASCHLLFVPRQADATGALQRAAAAGAILTVGESRTFESRGGMVTFVLDAGRVRFDVNQRQAVRTGLTLSSKVLRVARQVS